MEIKVLTKLQVWELPKGEGANSGVPRLQATGVCCSVANSPGLSGLTTPQTLHALGFRLMGRAPEALTWFRATANIFQEHNQCANRS